MFISISHLTISYFQRVRRQAVKSKLHKGGSVQRGAGVFWHGYSSGDVGKLDHKLQQRWAGVRLLDTGILLLGGVIDPAYNRL